MVTIPKARRQEQREVLAPDSFKDILSVAPDELLDDQDKQRRRNRGSAQNLMNLDQSATGGHKARQDHENEPAEVVIVCEPEGTSLMMGGLHPR